MIRSMEGKILEVWNFNNVLSIGNYKVVEESAGRDRILLLRGSKFIERGYWEVVGLIKAGYGDIS